MARKLERLTEDVRTRVSPEQHALIRAAAQLVRQTPADFIRESALEHARKLLEGRENAHEVLRDFVGQLEGAQTRSVGTGRAFAQILKAKHEAAGQ